MAIESSYRYEAPDNRSVNFVLQREFLESPSDSPILFEVTERPLDLIVLLTNVLIATRSCI